MIDYSSASLPYISCHFTTAYINDYAQEKFQKNDQETMNYNTSDSLSPNIINL